MAAAAVAAGKPGCGRRIGAPIVNSPANIKPIRSCCSCRPASAGAFRSARRCSMPRASSASMSKASAADAPPAGAARSRCRKAISPSTRSSPPTTTSRRRAPRKSATSACAACPNGRRLSCSAQILGDLVIDVPQDTVINAQIIRKDADDRVIERNAAVRICYVEVEEPDMHKPLGDLDRLKIALDEGLGLEGPADSTSHLHPAGAGDPAQGQLDRDRRHPPEWMPSRPLHHRPVAGPQERGLWHCLRHRLDHHRHASGVAAVGPHRRLVGHVEPADPLRRGSDEPRLLRDDEPGRPRSA